MLLSSEGHWELCVCVCVYIYALRPNIDCVHPININADNNASSNVQCKVCWFILEKCTYKKKKMQMKNANVVDTINEELNISKCRSTRARASDFQSGIIFYSSISCCWYLFLLKCSQKNGAERMRDWTVTLNKIVSSRANDGQ